MVGPLFELINQLNAPLYLGRFVLNRWLLVALGALILGTGAHRLVFRSDGAAADRALLAYVAGILFWKLFPAVRELSRVIRDPALLMGLHGSRLDAILGLAFALVVSAVGVILQPNATRPDALRGALRSLAVGVASALVVAIAVALIPAPALPFTGS